MRYVIHKPPWPQWSQYGSCWCPGDDDGRSTHNWRAPMQCWIADRGSVGLSWDEMGYISRHFHDDVIKWKHFPRYWPFVRGIHRSPVNPPHKGQWRRALMFSFICAWINRWVNNREAGDLIHHRAHYDVIVMFHMTVTGSLPLWSCDAVCWERSWSSLPQVMDWRQVMPSYSPNQCRLIVNLIL